MHDCCDSKLRREGWEEQTKPEALFLLERYIILFYFLFFLALNLSHCKLHLRSIFTSSSHKKMIFTHQLYTLPRKEILVNAIINRSRSLQTP